MIIIGSIVLSAVMLMPHETVELIDVDDETVASKCTNLKMQIAGNGNLREVKIEEKRDSRRDRKRHKLTNELHKLSYRLNDLRYTYIKDCLVKSGNGLTPDKVETGSEGEHDKRETPGGRV